MKRWDAGKLPWDLGHVLPNLSSFLMQSDLRPGRVLVPGCGSGYEVQAFHQAGHDVEAIDFSGPAVAHAREVLGPLGDRVIQGNFFKFDFSGHRYDLVYERGFLCSLPRERWADYASRMAELILPDGRLVGLFLYREEPEPPPFPLTDALAESVLGGFFKRVRTEAAAADTVPVYRGLERWQEWERKGYSLALR